MARSTFGGRIEQLSVAPDASLGGALKVAPGGTLPALYNGPLSDTGRSVVTDFLIDVDGDGIFETGATSITVDSDGYPPYFQGPDGVGVLYDVKGRALYPNTASGVPNASTAAAGIVELATDAEIDAGTDTSRAATPAGVKRKVDSRAATQDEAINTLSNAVGSKADLVGSTVPVSQLPASDGAVPETLALRRANGATASGTAVADDELPPLLQVRALITDGAGSGARVETLYHSTVLTATGTGTYVAIPTALITDAASGQKWECYCRIRYRSTANAGIKVRHKTGAAAVTNKLAANPSFETDLSSWTASAATATRQTAGGGHSGTAYAQLVATTNLATIQWTSEYIPTTSGTIWSAGAYGRLGTGTAKNFRIDIQFADAAGTQLTGSVGAAVTPTTGAWTQALNQGVGGVGITAPANTTQVRVRVAYVNTAVGDTIHVDSVQLENQAPLPAYGSTGGSGAGALTLEGSWLGLTTAAPTQDDYRRKTILSSTVLETENGARGATVDCEVEGSYTVTVGGTGLTDQRIELEFADRAADGANHAVIQAVSATFARVA